MPLDADELKRRLERSAQIRLVLRRATLELQRAAMDLDDPTAVALLAAEALGRAGIEHALYGGLLLAA